jgi:hypothetical protein
MVTNTIFTDKLEEYLSTPIEERKKKYDQNTRDQYNYKIKKYAKNALRNLTLIAAGYNEERVRDIFDADIMMSLLNAVVTKTNGVKTHHGEYFLALVYAIQSAASAAAISNDKEIIEIEVKRKPAVSPTYQQVDLTRSDKKKREILLKKIESNKYP